MMGIGMVFWLVIVAGIVLLVVWAVRTASGRGTGSAPQGADALEIARRRYASGEISKEQFEQLKKDLGG
jgi:putative membrane protein